MKRVDTMLVLGDIAVPHASRDCGLLEQIDESQASIVIGGTHCDLRQTLQRLVQAKARLEKKLKALESSIEEVLARIGSSEQASGGSPREPAEAPPPAPARPEQPGLGEHDFSLGIRFHEKDLESETLMGSDSHNRHPLPISTKRRRSAQKTKNPENSKSTEGLQTDPKKAGVLGKPSLLKKQQTTMNLPTDSASKLTEPRNESLLESHETAQKPLQQCDKQTQTDQRIAEKDSRPPPDFARPSKPQHSSPAKARGRHLRTECQAAFQTTGARKPVRRLSLLVDQTAALGGKKNRIIRISNPKPAQASKWPLHRPPKKNRSERCSGSRRDTYSGCVWLPTSDRVATGSPGRAAQVGLLPAADLTAKRAVFCPSLPKQSIRNPSTAPRSPKPRPFETRSNSPQPLFPRSARTIGSQQPMNSRKPAERGAENARTQVPPKPAPRSSRRI